jgi:hypothetical protein
MPAVPANLAEMTDQSIEARKRREIVALPRNQGKSNRAPARNLKVSEGTIRRDKKMLADPKLDSCHLWAKPTQPEIVRPYDWNSPRHLQRMLKTARGWIRDGNLRRAEWNQIAPLIYVWLAHDCLVGEPPTEDSDDRAGKIEAGEPRLQRSSCVYRPAVRPGGVLSAQRPAGPARHAGGNQP